MADELLIRERAGFSLVSIMARKGVSAGAIGEALDIELAAGPQFFAGDGFSLIGTGPGTWLAFADPAEAGFAGKLAARLGGLASISDQSGGYVIFNLSGPAARIALQRGAAIDFHDDAFGAGSVATTVIAHIGAIVWRAGENASYDIAVFRSFTSSFRDWLAETSATL